MKKAYNTIMISYPVYLGLALLSLALLDLSFLSIANKISIPLSIYTLEFDLTEQAIKIALASCGTAWLLYVPFRDYSGFFPHRLTIRVHRDVDGIQKRLTSIETHTPANISIYKNWRTKKIDFWRMASDRVMEETGKQVDFLSSSDRASKGEIVFKVRKISLLRQRYTIHEASGYIEHLDNNAGLPVEVRLKLIEDSCSMISVSIFDLVFKHKFLLQPNFLQYYKIDPLEERQFVDIKAITVVRFFPIMDIGDSVYFHQNRERWYPIAYCVYDFS